MAVRTRVRLLIERGQLQAAAELISAMPAAAEGMRCDREELETRLLHRCLKAKAAGDLGLAILESLAARGVLDCKACREALHVCGALSPLDHILCPAFTLCQHWEAAHDQ